jgi:hypothetical protein
MQCACKRWGPGTTSEKPIDSDNARELDAKMKLIMAEREKQNNFWTTPSSPAEEIVKTPVSPQIPIVSSTTANDTPQKIRFWN